MACMQGQKVVAEMLVVEQMARLDVKNWEGWTPMVWATVRGHTDIVKFLADRVRFWTSHAGTKVGGFGAEGLLLHQSLSLIPRVERYKGHAHCRGPAYNGCQIWAGLRCTLQP